MSNVYSLLLVDDEEIIRNGISRKIDWTAEGFRFLTPCEDGEAAIAMIRKEVPDVVITDICMPRVDGLEVARFAAENYPDTLVVILSGYEDFEYARKAMQYNVQEYILKPLSSRKIRELLQRIRDELDRKKAFQLDMDRLLGLQEESRQIILERFLCRMLTRPVPEEEIAAYESALPVTDPEIRYFCVLCLDVDYPDYTASGTVTLDLYLLALREQVEAIGEKIPWSLLCQPYEPRLILILGDRNEQSLLHTARFAGDQIHKTAQSLPDFTVSIGIGRTCAGMTGLHISYGEALAALENRLVVGDNGVFLYHRKKDVPGENIRFSHFPSEIRTALRLHGEERADELVSQFCSLLRSSPLTVHRIRLEIDKLVFSVIEFLDDLNEGIPYSESRDLTEELACVSGLPNLDQVEETLLRILKDISGRLRDKRRNYPEKKVYEIQEYLESHYASRDISVESVTTRFFISPSYLSKLFKQFTNKTFIEYLTGLRVAKACELLKTSNRKLFEIAELVGYSDPRYFSSIFKKYTGLTPSQYRDQL